MSESQILSACLQWLRYQGIFCWRANQGAIPTKDGKFRRFNGMRGCADILGILTQECACAKQGILLAVEVKKPGGKLSEAQKDFLQEVNDRGGLGICVYSVDELEHEMRQYI